MILAFPASTDFEQINAIYGTYLPNSTLDPSDGTVKTIIGFQDIAGSPALRAGIIGETAIPTMLTDGRIALSGTFSASLLADKDKLSISELTPAQLDSLTPTPPQL